MNRLVVTGNAKLRLAHSAPCQMVLIRVINARDLRMEWKRPGGAEKQNCCSGFQVHVSFIFK